MARTTTEMQISRSRKGGLLVPMIEERMRHPLNVDDEQDAKFVYELLQKQAERESERQREKRFSPSQLASCLRQVYMTRNYKGPRVKQTRIEPNFYFLTGDWLHVKWQFVLYKMDREGVEGFKLIDCEIPVVSKHGDHGGTMDAAVEIHTEPLGIDFKGLNVRSFNQAVVGKVDPEYLIQLADYLMLWNSMRGNTRIERGLLVIENKGGPDPNHPIALTEISVVGKDFIPEIRTRLEWLREHERTDTIPPPSCQTVNGIQFQGCPFRKFCREEVKEIQRANAKSGDTAKLRVASPDRKRTVGSRRNSRR